MWNLINKERKKLNLDTLSFDYESNFITYNKSFDLLFNNYFSHLSLEGVKTLLYVKKHYNTNNNVISSYGENLGNHIINNNYNELELAECFTKGCFNSKLHYENVIFKKFNYVNINVMKNKLSNNKYRYVIN